MFPRPFTSEDERPRQAVRDYQAPSTCTRSNGAFFLFNVFVHISNAPIIVMSCGGGCGASCKDTHKSSTTCSFHRSKHLVPCTCAALSRWLLRLFKQKGPNSRRSRAYKIQNGQITPPSGMPTFLLELHYFFSPQSLTQHRTPQHTTLPRSKATTHIAGRQSNPCSG